MEYIKKEWKRVGGSALMLLGAFLTIEHTLTWGRVDMFDFLGHEVLGLVLFLAGFCTANAWGRLTFKEGIKYVPIKLKYFLEKIKK